MLIDSHSHLHFPVYKSDIENIFSRMKEKNVTTLTVGTSYKNSLEAVEFSKKFGIPCSVGFHPSHARPPLDPLLRKEGTEAYLDPNEEVYDEEFDAGKLRSLIKLNISVIPDFGRSFPEGSVGSRNKKQKEKDLNSFGFLDSLPRLSPRFDRVEAGGKAGSSKAGMTIGRVVAIGECGLDYFRLPDDESLKEQFKQKQREAFESQIELAQEFDLPLIIHTRASKKDPTDAYRDTLEIFASCSLPRASSPGVMHCFLGSPEWAKKFLDLGFMLSFSGILTFKKADEIRESAKVPPSDMILTETDCPYLAPEPHRGKQNEPSYVEYILRKLEEMRGERLEDKVEENFNRLFGI